MPPTKTPAPTEPPWRHSVQRGHVQEREVIDVGLLGLRPTVRPPHCPGLDLTEAPRGTGAERQEKPMPDVRRPGSRPGGAPAGRRSVQRGHQLEAEVVGVGLPAVRHVAQRRRGRAPAEGPHAFLHRCAHSPPCASAPSGCPLRSASARVICASRQPESRSPKRQRIEATRAGVFASHMPPWPV